MKKFGLLGKNISYTFSPILHENIFKTYNLGAEYSVFDVQNEKDIDYILNDIRNGKLDGINVTVPFKEVIIDYLDVLSTEAEYIGAVNCIKLENGELKGYNTDYFGLIETLKKMNLDLINKKVFILGSGGAAKATFKAIKDLKGKPFIVSRDIKNLSSTFDKGSVLTYDDLETSSGFLLINATPVGTFPEINVSPASQNIIKNFDYILDLIYNPKETLFLKMAKDSFKTYENGFFMLVAQGVKSEEIWNNRTFDYNLIYRNLTSSPNNNSEESLK